RKRTGRRRGRHNRGRTGRSDRGPDRAVCRGNRNSTLVVALRCRTGRDAGGGGYTGGRGTPVGARTADHPGWVVPVDWAPTHELPPLEAVLTTPNGLEIRPYTRGFGAMVDGAAIDPADRPHLGVALMLPRSRGRLSVASGDSDVPPVIEHRYDSDPHDVA